MFTEERPYRRLGWAIMNPRALRASYDGAHKRAHWLREELRELELQIRQAQWLMTQTNVPSWPPLPYPVRPPTLHDAIRSIIEATGNRWTRTGWLARELARRKLYRRWDGLPASTKDVSARISTYREMFERQGPMVRLREPRDGRADPEVPLTPPAAGRDPSPRTA